MLKRPRMLELDDKAKSLDTPSEVTPLEKAPPTVLVVDDDRAVREVLSAVLREEGYSVRMSESATAALELMRGGDLPLLLCDVKMPERDGMWLLDQAPQRHPPPPVVVLT